MMVQHGRCLRCLKYICDILFGCPVDALRHLAALNTIIDEHHTLWLQLYGEGLGTPKLHWLFHVVEQIRKSGCLNCFKPERNHNKTHAAGVLVKRWGRDYECYVIKRTLWDLFGALPEVSFEAEAIIGSHVNQNSKTKTHDMKKGIQQTCKSKSIGHIFL